MRRFSLFLVAMLALTILTTSAFAIQYVAPSNNANQSLGASNLLFLDNTNARVGIGTGQPNQTLHIAGTFNVTGIAQTGTLYTPQLCLNGDCKTAWPSSSGGGNVTATMTTGYVQVATNTTNIGNSVLYQSGNNVGIGTTSPNNTFQVIGNGNFTGILYASNISSNSPLNLMTQGTTRLYINDTTGYVGIGTTQPTDMLTINRTSGTSGIRIGASNFAPVNYTFNYTGGSQTFVVGAGVANITVDVVGARGGGAGGENGSRVQGTINVTEGQTIYIYVGGTTANQNGGYNGGGSGGADSCSNYYGYGGGGASDVRINATLSGRVMIAGGGGGDGGGGSSYAGGLGGTGNGNGSNGLGTNYGSGGTAGAGSLGVGSSAAAGMGWSCGSSYQGGGGGGGGGYYGGGAGYLAGCGDDPGCDTGASGGGGGGGTNLTPSGGTTTNSYNSAGNGYVLVSVNYAYEEYTMAIDSTDANFKIGKINSTGIRDDISIDPRGYVGIGINQPETKLHAKSSIQSGYVALIQNDANNQTGNGILVRAGANDGSGITYYLTAQDGNGDITGYVRSNSGTFQLVDISDRNTKTNIQRREFNALDKVRNVEVVEFNRKQNPNGPKITGFVAQDLQQVYPEAVAIGPDGTLGIAKAELVPLLFKAIQEQENKITLQQQQIDALAQGKAIPKGQATATPSTGGGTALGNDIIVKLGTSQDVVVALG